MIDVPADNILSVHLTIMWEIVWNTFVPFKILVSSTKLAYIFSKGWKSKEWLSLYYVFNSLKITKENLASVTGWKTRENPLEHGNLIALWEKKIFKRLICNSAIERIWIWNVSEKRFSLCSAEF